MFSTWHRLFWLGGGALAILLIVALVMNPWLPSGKQVDRRIMGLDFTAFYTAGSLVREGQSHDLYDLVKVEKFQKKLATRNNLELKNTAGWWNPPVYALVFSPLSALNFRAAYWTWLCFNAGSLAAAIFLLINLLPIEMSWKYRALVPLLVCVSMPTIQAMGHAQNSAISLLILAGAVTLALKHRPIAAGLVCGLLLYKPQIALAVAVILGLSTHWRLWLGIAATAAIVLAINLLTLPGTLERYVSALGPNLHAIQFGQTYIWERQATLAGFWRLLFQGRAAGERSTGVFVLTLISQIALAAGLALTWWRLTPSPGTPGEGEGTSAFSVHRSAFPYVLTLPLSISTSLNIGRSPRRENQDRYFAFMIPALTAMPLLLPYFLDYDLLLLAVPATLFARTALAHPNRTGTILWTALYLCLLINPGLGRLTHINFAVPLLATLSATMMIATERKQSAVSFTRPAPQNDLRFAA